MTAFTRRQFVAAAAAAASTPLGSSISNANAPATGKQNAGFYRYKVGSFEITVVTDGSGTNPLSDAYVANAPKTAVNAALEAEFLAKDKVTHAYTPVVVNTGSKLVAIDTGSGSARSRRARARSASTTAICRPPASTQRGRCRDHLALPRRSHQRPGRGRQQAGVPERRDDGAGGRMGILVGRQQPEQAARGREAADGQLQARVRSGRQQVHQVSGRQGAGAGHHLDRDPGHTPGHVSYTIASGDSIRCWCSPTSPPASRALFVRNPDWQFVFDTDKAQAVETRKKLYDMAAAERMPVQGYHFPFPALVHVEKSGSGYRLVPVAWNPML